MTPELSSFSPSIYTVDHPQTVLGMQFGTRCTVVVLPSGRCVLISPVAFDDLLAEKIEAIGPVDTIIAPNLFHHLYFNQACRRWPEARRLIAPGLDQKVDLIEDVHPMAQQGSIEGILKWRALEGAPKVGEHLFFDTRDEVLVVTDIAFHFIDHPQWWLRTVMRLQGGYGQLGPSRLLRSLIEDDSAFGESLSPILDEPWDSIIVAHGTPIPSGGKDRFKEAFAHYLPQSP